MSKVEVGFHRTYIPGEVIEGKSSGFSAIVPDSGSYFLKSDFFKKWLGGKGKYDLIIARYTPIIRHLSNGKDILVIGISSHNITVIVDD